MPKFTTGTVLAKIFPSLSKIVDLKFSFLNIKPGFYTFTSYEVLGDYDSTYYYNGSWAPFKRAAKFGIYPDVLEVRNHWDIKDMVILVK